jgi:hypothetical protein
VGKKKMLVHKDAKKSIREISKEKIHDQLQLGKISMQTVCYLTIPQKFEILEIQGQNQCEAQIICGTPLAQ